MRNIKQKCHYKYNILTISYKSLSYTYIYYISYTLFGIKNKYKNNNKRVSVIVYILHLIGVPNLSTLCYLHLNCSTLFQLNLYSLNDID